MPQRSPRVAIVQRSIRRYRGDFYDRLRDELKRSDVRLRLLHSTPLPGQDPRDDAMDVPWAERLPRYHVPVGGRSLLWQPAVPAVQTADLVVVEQAADLALNYRLLARQRRGGPDVVMWGHGRDFSEGDHCAVEAVKAHTTARAHWVLAYTERAREAFVNGGYPAHRITVVNNAIDTAALTTAIDEAARHEVPSLRAELDLGDGPIAVFVGTMRPDKRIDHLLAAGSRIARSVPGFRLVLVGGGPDHEAVSERVATLPWARALGPSYGGARAAALALADVVLLPGAVGLAVLDAFAAGAPLVTSRSGRHGPELAYLDDGRNGLLVDDVGDPRAYADAVITLLTDPRRLAAFQRECRADALRYDLDHMVANFASGIGAALEAPRVD